MLVIEMLLVSTLDFEGCFSMKIGNKVQSRSTKEMTRMIDGENSEENCAKATFGHKSEFIDAKVTSTSKTKKEATSMMKFVRRHDHCS